jgi:hypothetical protein
MSEPRFEDVVDDDVTGPERERLLRAHELLLQADPPPELPRSLAQPPAPPTADVRLFPRRRALTFALIAAALTAAAFAAGYALHKPARFSSASAPIAMKGTQAAPAALASIRLAKKDTAGNWPMQIEEHGLKPLPKGGYYQLWLTKQGKPAASCGTFAVTRDQTTVEMNVPYNLSQYNGWIVTAYTPGHHTSQPLLAT